MFISESLIRYINPVLMFLLALLVFQGYRKGFLNKILSSVSFLVIVIVGWNLAPAFSTVFKILPRSYAPYQDTPLADFFYMYTNQILIFVVIVVLASIVIFLLKPITEIFTSVPGISFVNATLGAFFGVVEMTLFSFVLLFVLHSPIIQNGQEVIDQTFFKQINHLQERVFTIGSDVLNEFDVLSDSIDNEANALSLKNLLVEHGYSDQEVQNFIEQLGE